MKNDIYPLTIVKDRYNGTYSGGKWTAWNLSYVPSKIDADDTECADFFIKPNLIYGRGETPQEAIEDLKFFIQYGKHMSIERIKEVSESTDDDEEEEKMEPTSKQVINGVKVVQIHQDPDGESTRLTLENDDDTFEIEINGHESYEAFRRLIFNDHNYNEVRKKNKELAEENEDLKKHTVAKALEYIEMNNKLRDENEELKYQLKDIQATKEVVEQKLDTRAGILDQAEKCVCGQREQDYGTPESNFQLIADLWNDYLGNNLSKEKRDFEKELGVTHNHKELSVPWKISAMDVAMMMALMKIARIRNGGGSCDSFVDLAGYAACGGEIWAEERKSKDLK